MLQQVPPNVTSITKHKPGQHEDAVQCGVVSFITHTEWPPENGASMREGAIQVHTEEENDVCVGQSGEVVEEVCTDQDESCFSKDDLDLQDVGMNRTEDQHNYCLSQSDGARNISLQLRDRTAKKNKETQSKPRKCCLKSRWVDIKWIKWRKLKAPKQTPVCHQVDKWRTNNPGLQTQPKLHPSGRATTPKGQRSTEISCVK
uniref:Uncharacterized protein n=1 Tax=Magallana gigas TaxID=29159 RepID=A0A8W8JKI5_MAGGI